MGSEMCIRDRVYTVFSLSEAPGASIFKVITKGAFNRRGLLIERIRYAEVPVHLQFHLKIGLGTVHDLRLSYGAR